MSIENFRDRYDFPDFKQEILREKERFPQMSAPAFLAMKFADFGAEELKKEEKEIAQKNSLYVARFGRPYQITARDAERVILNYTTVIFGLSIKFTEDSLIEGIFDKPGFVREHNDSIKGSVFYGPLHSEPWDVNLIPNDRLKQMRKLAEEKLTLSIFFEEGYELMPHFIQQHVGHRENLERIKRRIIPIFKPLEQKLVT